MLAMRVGFAYNIQAPVVRKVDNTNRYPVDSVVCLDNTYPLDSAIQPSNKRSRSFDSLPVGPISPGEGGEGDKKELSFLRSLNFL